MSTGGLQKGKQMHELYRKVLKELKRVVMATIGLNEGFEGMGRLKLLRVKEI